MFYMKFGTKHATCEHDHFMKLQPIYPLDISNQTTRSNKELIK